MHTNQARQARKRELQTLIASLREPTPERMAESAALAEAAKARINASGGIMALSPADYRAERAAALARLKGL